jgi:fermentation-respiration switch protein FrsA (DUF1100 family)
MSDDTIRYVGRTWEPRLLANGVNPNDYRRVVDGLETWDQWYGAWMDLGRAHEALARDAASEGRAATAGEAYYRAAIDYLAGRDDVDGARVGVCGVSLGGYLEPRLRAVASCGGLHSLEEGRLHRGLHLARWLHIWGARDPEDLAARTRGATLAGCAGRIVAPLLVVHGAQDNLIPPEDAYRTYEQARGPKQWALYPDGNHVCNNITYKYRPLVADFMAEHLR